MRIHSGQDYETLAPSVTEQYPSGKATPSQPRTQVLLYVFLLLPGNYSELDGEA